VAAWFIDGDYDGQCFCITQAFFPDKKAWEKLSKALTGRVDPERFEAFSGRSPCPSRREAWAGRGQSDRPRGTEVLRVHKVDGYGGGRLEGDVS